MTNAAQNVLVHSQPSGTIPMLIGGAWRTPVETYEVRDPYRGVVTALAPRSSMGDLDDALAAAVEAKVRMAAMPGFQRAALLRRVGTLLVERAGTIAEVMARETGKAIKDARAEVIRSQDTVMLSAEEAVPIEGEHVPLDATAMGAGKICFMLRFPVGVVAGITPFNAPFNLACHEVAPALASGNA
jgi:acyl-CoA reductase-like NAD-dependent aldehyde dehydrogenase